MGETAVASARVPKNLKRRVDARLRRRGLSPSDMIARAYEYVDRHGEVPWAEETEASSRSAKDTMDRLDALIARMPTNTPLSTMTIEQYKEELANRDI